MELDINELNKYLKILYGGVLQCGLLSLITMIFFYEYIIFIGHKDEKLI